MELDLGARQARLAGRLDRLAEVVSVLEKMERVNNNGNGGKRSLNGRPVEREGHVFQAVSDRVKSSVRALRLLRRDRRGRRAFWSSFLPDVGGISLAFAAISTLAHGVLGMLEVLPTFRDSQLCPLGEDSTDTYQWARFAPSSSGLSTSAPDSCSASFLANLGTAAAATLSPCWIWQHRRVLEHAFFGLLGLAFFVSTVYALSEDARLAAGLVISPSDRAVVEEWLSNVGAGSGPEARTRAEEERHCE